MWSEKGVVDLSPISAVVRFLAGSATANGPVGFTEAKYAGFHLKDYSFSKLKDGCEIDDEVVILFFSSKNFPYLLFLFPISLQIY